MNITAKTHRPRSIVKELATAFGTHSKENCLEEILEMPEKYGKGKIHGFDFENGIGILIADCQLKDGIKITIDNDIPPLLFSFCVRGELWHYFDHDKIQYQFSPLQGTIAANVVGSVQRLEFPEKMDYLFAIILVERAIYLKKFDGMLEDIPEHLADVFRDQEAQRPFFYKNNYNITSADLIKKIGSNNDSCMVRSIFAESKTLELLSHQIKQFHDDIKSPGRRIKLRPSDVEIIQQARDLLIEDLTSPPTIEALARLTGINRQKLKSGFKLVYESTINAYLRNERLEQASMRILQGESVSQAMTEVGYSNRGHFSQKFQEKYGVLPKDYLQTVKSKVPD